MSDPEAVTALAERVAELGGLRSLAHAAGISPTMADWRRIIEVDLVGTALLVRALEPLTSPASAAVCWASIAGHGVAPDDELDAALDDPLARISWTGWGALRATASAPRARAMGTRSAA